MGYAVSQSATRQNVMAKKNQSWGTAIGPEGDYYLGAAFGIIDYAMDRSKRGKNRRATSGETSLPRRGLMLQV
jgi:hypothetical protein